MRAAASGVDLCVDAMFTSDDEKQIQNRKIIQSCISAKWALRHTKFVDSDDNYSMYEDIAFTLIGHDWRRVIDHALRVAAPVALGICAHQTRSITGRVFVSAADYTLIFLAVFLLWYEFVSSIDEQRQRSRSSSIISNRK